MPGHRSAHAIRQALVSLKSNARRPTLADASVALEINRHSAEIAERCPDPQPRPFEIENTESESSVPRPKYEVGQRQQYIACTSRKVRTSNKTNQRPRSATNRRKVKDRWPNATLAVSGARRLLLLFTTRRRRTRIQRNTQRECLLAGRTFRALELARNPTCRRLFLRHRLQIADVLAGPFATLNCLFGHLAFPLFVSGWAL